jgi:hypothetical protein
MWDTTEGGTCGLDPIKYTRLGGAFAASRALYYPFVDNSADGCGVCYEGLTCPSSQSLLVSHSIGLITCSVRRQRGT